MCYLHVTRNDFDSRSELGYHIWLKDMKSQFAESQFAEHEHSANYQYNLYEFIKKALI